MKKVIIAALLLSFISAAPVFAMRVITNTDLDRTVPSRSFKPGAEITEETTTYGNKYKPTNLYQGIAYEKYYKPVLSNGIRRDLIGTTWDFPEYGTATPQQVVKKTYYNKLGKRYMREAADYYVVDTIRHPNNAIMAGYDEPTR